MPLKFANNQSLTSVTALPSAVPTDNLILISTQTASSSATISFTTGLDSTYDEYIFTFINIHPATNGASFRVNFSTDSGSNYNVTKTTTSFEAYHNEADNDVELRYDTAYDQAQSTAFLNIADEVQNSNDAHASGTFTLFNPSSTTYVKHFISNFEALRNPDYSWNYFKAGYANTTSAINAIRFQFSSGNIDDGIIKMYGVKKS
jgi:hypothetical protein